MSQMLPRHGRYDFSPINERPDFSWPDGKRLASATQDWDLQTNQHRSETQVWDALATTPGRG